MPTAKFELFEAICEELEERDTFVLTTDYFAADEADDMFAELRRQFNQTSNDTAIDTAIASLSQHFAARNSRLPFGFDPTTRRFWSEDRDYVSFITKVQQFRSTPGATAKQFETEVTKRLLWRLQGVVECVGWPRAQFRKFKEYRKYLKRLGFGPGVVYEHDRDGGFDIIWMPPLGAVPHRPIISIQCKNTDYLAKLADESLGPARRSLDNGHLGLKGAKVHLCCVMFNDYIEAGRLGKKALDFIPLGLSDLALPSYWEIPVYL